MSFDCINTNLTKVLYRYAPIKNKFVRANDGPFMTKELRKAIMHRSKLKNKYNRNKTNENWNAFEQQRNKCVAILRSSKLIYYRNLGTQNLADNRNNWKTVKPVLADRVQVSPTINLLENGELVNNDLKIAQILNEYFTNTTDELEIKENEANLSLAINIEDSIDQSVYEYKNHPIIKMIKKQWVPQELFEFNEVDAIDVFDQLKHSQ